MSGNYKKYAIAVNGIDNTSLLTNGGWDTTKNGSRRAALAGHGQAVAKEVHLLALDLMERGMTYDAAETLILSTVSAPVRKIELNEKLDKYSQPFRPGPELNRERKNSGIIMKAKHRNKSSKGKHPSNYTPPKKKRK